MLYTHAYQDATTTIDSEVAWAGGLSLRTTGEWSRDLKVSCNGLLNEGYGLGW